MDELPILLLAAKEFPQPPLPLWALELLAKVLLGGWLFCLGACVGSFLNVVVYRLPRGMNLVHPGSHCPACGHAIRPRDNVPLLSWLLLGAKCRDCGAPISPRYYYVELVVGLAFLLLAVFAAFLPRHEGPIVAEFGRRLLTARVAPEFWCGYGLHVVLLATLIAAALIDSDGFRTPWKLFLPALLAGLVMPMIWPEIRDLSALPGLALPTWQSGLLDGVAGLFAGLLMGAVAELGWLAGSRRRGWMRSAPLWALAAVGMVVGWQRAMLVAPLSLAIFAALVALLRLARPGGVVPLAGIVAVVVGWMLTGWATPLDRAVASLVAHPFAWCAGLAGATALAAFVAGQLAPAENFAFQSPPVAETLPPVQAPLHEPTHPAT